MRQRWQLAAGLLRAPYSIHDVRAFSGLANGCTVPEDLVAASQVKCDVPMWQLASWRSPPVEFHPAEAPPTGQSVCPSCQMSALKLQRVNVTRVRILVRHQENANGAHARLHVRCQLMWPKCHLSESDAALPPATALSWLRRRGPDVHDSVLHHAFRKRQVCARPTSREVIRCCLVVVLVLMALLWRLM